MATLIINPSSEGIQRPDWLIVSPEQVEKARRVITRDFWAAPNPFIAPVYKEIGFPFLVGQLPAQSVNDIYQSAPFRHARDSGRRYTRTFKILMTGREAPGQPIMLMDSDKPLPAFLQSAARELMRCDRHIYGQDKLLWQFTADISAVSAHQVQRSGNAAKYHIDYMPGGRNGPHTSFVEPWAKAFREGGSVFWPKNMQITGVPRMLVVSNHFPTHFKGRKPFKALDVVHFIAEQHYSPEVPEACTRFFLRATAIPL